MYAGLLDVCVSLFFGIYCIYTYVCVPLQQYNPQLFPSCYHLQQSRIPSPVIPDERDDRERETEEDTEGERKRDREKGERKGPLT